LKAAWSNLRPGASCELGMILSGWSRGDGGLGHALVARRPSTPTITKAGRERGKTKLFPCRSSGRQCLAGIQARRLQDAWLPSRMHRPTCVRSVDPVRPWDQGKTRHRFSGEGPSRVEEGPIDSGIRHPHGPRTKGNPRAVLVALRLNSRRAFQQKLRSMRGWWNRRGFGSAGTILACSALRRFSSACIDRAIL
jgi:hypothetical protein